MAIETGGEKVEKLKKFSKKVEKRLEKERKGKKTEVIIEQVIDKETGEVSFKQSKPVVKQGEIVLNPTLPFFKFEFQQLLVKKDNRTVTLNLINYLSKIFLYYSIVLTCDTAPFEQKIQGVLDAKAQYEAKDQPELLPDLRRQELHSYDNQVRDLRVQMRELIDQCPDIAFHAEVNKVDNTGDDIKLELLINKKALAKLNRIWDKSDNYKMQLQHSVI